MDYHEKCEAVYLLWRQLLHFRESTMDDALIAEIKNGKIGYSLINRTIYRTKVLLRKLTGR